MPIKKLSIYAISEEWPQEELNTNFQFASTAKKNTLPYEGGVLSNLQMPLENISHPFLLSFQL